MNKISLIGTLTIATILLSGCDDNGSSPTITKYGTDKCFIDSIDGKADTIVYVKPGKVEFVGWAFDDVKQATVKNLQIHLAGAQGEPISVTNPVRIRRVDVAKHYNNENLNDSGFKFIVDTSKLPPGAYGVTLAMPEGKAIFICQSKKFVVVN